MSLIVLYSACMVAGGGFVLLSILSGADHDHDFDTDVDADLDFDGDLDVDADADFGEAHADFDGHVGDVGHGVNRRGELARLRSSAIQRTKSFNPLTSFRFWTFGLAFFGLAGLIFAMVLSLSVPLQLALSIPLGLLVGGGASYGVHRLGADQSGSMTRQARMIGAEGVVRVSVRGSVPGRVMLDLGHRTLPVLAISDSEKPLPVGSHVVVIGFEGHKARVVLRTEFLPESDE